MTPLNSLPEIFAEIAKRHHFLEVDHQGNLLFGGMVPKGEVPEVPEDLRAAIMRRKDEIIRLVEAFGGIWPRWAHNDLHKDYLKTRGLLNQPNSATRPAAVPGSKSGTRNRPQYDNPKSFGKRGKRADRRTEGRITR